MTTTQTQTSVLRDTIAALDDAGITSLVIGSLAGAVHHVPGPHEDIDVFVFEADSRAAIDALVRRGFEPEHTDLDWLRKARRDGITVDVIHEVTGGIRLDDDMLARACTGFVEGVRLRVMPPEDYAVSQSISAGPETPEHWFNAVTVLSKNAIDWEIVLRRAGWHPGRTRALLAFVDADGGNVPGHVMRALMSGH